MSDSVNIAAYLPKQAEAQPDQPAIYMPSGGRDANGRTRYDHYTYRQLDEVSDHIARGLQKVGIGRGTRTVLMVKPSLELFSLVFAMFKVGAVLVMVDPGLGLKNLKMCLARTAPEAFVGIPPAHVARVLFGWGRGTVKTLVTAGRRLFWGGHTLAQVQALGDDGTVAVSGEFLDKCLHSIQVNRLTDRIKDASQAFHSVALRKHRLVTLLRPFPLNIGFTDQGDIAFIHAEETGGKSFGNLLVVSFWIMRISQRGRSANADHIVWTFVRKCPQPSNQAGNLGTHGTRVGVGFIKDQIVQGCS